ncbi:MAG: hypothetical protein AAGA10_03920 [Bacteroidota bacterium]
MWNWLKNKISSHPFFIRLFNWEYWPMPVLMFPVLFIWIGFSIRARSGVFFSAANPSIDMGGFAGESKMDILSKFPAQVVPETHRISAGTPLVEILPTLADSGLSFPIIAKPDKGERGFKVEKIKGKADLNAYIEECPTDFLLQEFIDLPTELGILYYRFPGAEKGKVTSLTLKKFLTVTGDGKSSVEELIKSYPRAKLQYKVLKASRPQLMSRIPKDGEIVELVPIGNHARGATFLDRTDLVDTELEDRFDQLFQKLDGIYFGRLDIKCHSLESLKSGGPFYILEFNGVKAEPTHIYQPGFSLLKAYKVLYAQWKVIYKISVANHRRGIPYDPFIPTLKKLQAHQRYKKSIA